MEVREPSAKYLAKAGYKQTEVGVIPEDWQVGLLADRAQIRTGIAKNANASLIDPIEVPYLRVANVQDGYLDLSEVSTIKIDRSDLRRFSVLPNDVLMNEGGDLDKLGRGALWRGEILPCVHQNHVFVVRCKDGLLPEFLNAWTSSPVARRYFLLAGRQTTNLASINKTSLGQLPVPFPTRAVEQQAIAGALGDADTLIESLEHLLAKKRQIKQGAMQALLTGERRLPGFAEAWNHGMLGDVIDSLEAGVSVNSDEGEPAADAPCVLKTSAILSGQFSPTECKPIVRNEWKRARTSLRGDSILISRMNTPDLVGEVGYVEIDYPWIFLPDRVWMTRFRASARINARWLCYLLSTPEFKLRIQDLATGTSGSMKNISKGALLSLSLPYPTVEEQTAIATALSDMDAEIAALEARLAKARQVKLGMMQALLTGRIRLV
jgi:type I restriction enzyme S subunit